MDWNKKIEIKEEAKKRVSKFEFGDPVTNVCAGKGNPRKHSYFVEYVVSGYTNNAGIRHNEYLAKCTDRKGKFWNTDIDVIYEGHLSEDDCEKLWQPIWEANYG